MEQAPHLCGIGCYLCGSTQLLTVTYRLTNSLFSSLYSSIIMIGFDASGHVAEETKNAR